MMAARRRARAATVTGVEGGRRASLLAPGCYDCCGEARHARASSGARSRGRGPGVAGLSKTEHAVRRLED